MKRGWIIGIVGGLTLAVLGLGTALAVSVATDDSRPQTPAAGYANCQGAWRMVAGPGDWNPAQMHSYMEQTLGADGYNDMVNHMRDVLNGNYDDSHWGGMMGGSDNGDAWGGPWAGMMGGMAHGWSPQDLQQCWGWMMN